MDRQFRALVDQVAAGVIARREFLRKTAILTGGTAAGLHALGRLAEAQPKGKLRVVREGSIPTDAIREIVGSDKCE